MMAKTASAKIAPLGGSRPPDPPGPAPQGTLNRRGGGCRRPPRPLLAPESPGPGLRGGCPPGEPILRMRLLAIIVSPQALTDLFLHMRLEELVLEHEKVWTILNCFMKELSLTEFDILNIMRDITPKAGRVGPGASSHPIPAMLLGPILRQLSPKTF